MAITAEMEMEAKRLEASAAAHEAGKEASFERSDTDGFLSQWASGICASRDRLQAEIVRNGGMAEFPALFYLNGERAPAKLITVKDKFNYGRPKSLWAIVDPETGRFTGQFINRWTGGKRSAANMAAKGFKEGTEMAPAKAEIVGYGKGLSGNAWAAVVRADRGW